MLVFLFPLVVSIDDDIDGKYMTGCPRWMMASIDDADVDDEVNANSARVMQVDFMEAVEKEELMICGV